MLYVSDKLPCPNKRNRATYRNLAIREIVKLLNITHGKTLILFTAKDDMQYVYHELQEAEMIVIASPIYYHGFTGQLKCTIDRFYAAAYPKKPEKLKKVAMFLSSGDQDMYDGALFSYRGDFLDYLKLEDMGIFTTHGYDPGVPEEKLEELRRFGESLK